MQLHEVVRGVEVKEVPERFDCIDECGNSEDAYYEGQERGVSQGYNHLASAEVVVDREKMANTILFELQAGKWQLVNTLVNSGDVVDIADAIATAIESGDVLSLKKEG